MQSSSLDCTYLILRLSQRYKLLRAVVVPILFINVQPAAITLPGTQKTENKNQLNEWIHEEFILTIIRCSLHSVGPPEMLVSIQPICVCTALVAGLDSQKQLSSQQPGAPLPQPTNYFEIPNLHMALCSAFCRQNPEAKRRSSYLQEVH